MTCPPLLALLLTDLPELVDLRGRAGQGSLHHLDPPGHEVAPCGRIGDGLGLDLDDADAGIVRPAIVLAVTEITHPRLERGAVVLLDGGAVGEDLGRAGDGGPFAGGVEEGDVDGRVLVEIVSLAGLGIGVEEEVDATSLLGFARLGQFSSVTKSR